MERPRELVPVGIKKPGRIPPARGWRTRGRQATATRSCGVARIGFADAHSAIEDVSPLAHSGILTKEQTNGGPEAR